MSALGQKQTCAAQNVMSALPPIATSNATYGMSALGHKRTSQTSVDNLVGTLLQKQWHVQPEPFRRLKIDSHHEFRRQLYRQLGRLCAFEDAVDIACRSAELVGHVDAIGY